MSARTTVLMLAITTSLLVAATPVVAFAQQPPDIDALFHDDEALAFLLPAVQQVRDATRSPGSVIVSDFEFLITRVDGTDIAIDISAAAVDLFLKIEDIPGEG
jgi:hypothetical protein